MKRLFLGAALAALAFPAAADPGDVAAADLSFIAELDDAGPQINAVIVANRRAPQEAREAADEARTVTRDAVARIGHGEPGAALEEGETTAYVAGSYAAVKRRPDHGAGNGRPDHGAGNGGPGS